MLYLNRQNANGPMIDLRINGAQIGSIGSASENLVIKSVFEDRDILLKGNDEGTEITAATFDMSNEGFLTLNDGISINASSFMNSGTLMFTSSGNAAFVDNRQCFFGSSLDMTIKHNSTTGNNEILTNSDLLLDSATAIILDADSGGDIKLKDGGTQYGKLSKSSNDFIITSSIENGDIVLKGDDAGSAVLALTLDMSEAGAAIFNNNVTAFSDRRLKDNIETLDSQKTYQMRGVSYTRDGRPGSGVIAQEMEEVAPELVLTNDDGIKSVDYGKTVGYLIETIKDLKKEVDELRNEMKTLREDT